MKTTRAKKKLRRELEGKLFDLRTRIPDIAGRDPDLRVYGILRYWQPEKRRELLESIRALRRTLRLI